jgi:hypothetical protein
MTEQITRGCVPRLNAGETIAGPIVQVTSIKKLDPATARAAGPERYRVLLSDGDHFMQGMLATQKNMVSRGINCIGLSVCRGACTQTGPGADCLPIETRSSEKQTNEKRLMAICYMWESSREVVLVWVRVVVLACKPWC